MDRKYVALLVLIVLAGAAWYFWPEGDWPIKNVPPSQPTIALFGDSLAYGYGAPNPSTQGPAALLEERFGRPVLNFGRPGDTTEAGLLRVPQLLVRKPGLVIISLGGNDYLQRRPLDESFANLRKAVEQFQQAGAVTAIIGLEPVASLGYSYSPRFRSLARETGSLLISDALDGILDRPSLRSDNTHPNAEGYKLLTDRIAEVIGPVVQQMPPAPAQ